MKESLEDVVTLHSVTNSAFQSLCSYLYSGNAEKLTPDDAITLICTSSHILDER